MAAAHALDLREWIAKLLQQVEAWGAWGILVFVVAYVVAAVLLIPGSALTLGAGAVFGLLRGTVIVSVASTLAAAAAFLIGRHGAREAVARRLEANPRFAALDRAVAEEGWKIVLLTRLSPVFPYTLLNYAFGLTRVKFSHYVLASWVGMLPGTVMYVYLGTLARVAADRSRTPAEWALYGVGLAATVAVTVLITRTARRALADKTATGEKTDA
ncbi:MAG: TVP38/TMEM64 family protein [Verrucomicrobia bacterium]|nr:MAG: TVP38/TMEM64 family protein [Verrucomicrobiota bacterium]